MFGVSNTITYRTVFEDRLQERLDQPTTFKEMCELKMMNDRVYATSYMSTEPSEQTVTRGNAINLQTFAETNETLTISTGRDLGMFVDFADEAQSPWTDGVEAFDRIGAILNEFIEANVLAQHASWTDFDNASIGGSAGNITVSAANIDDIIRGVKREVREANGQSLWNRNGLGFVWRAADFELLESFVQAVGFMTADKALREGTLEGFTYLGSNVHHYWSNGHTANHVFAGVRKIQMLGILKKLHGRAFVDEFPASSAEDGPLSGTMYYAREEIGHLTPTAHAGLVFDVAVE